MHIIIVGAGIGGLAAAAVLRRQGHEVTVYEQSKLNQETGAAILLPPNVNGPLRKYNFVPENYGAVPCLRTIQTGNWHWIGKLVLIVGPLQQLHKGLRDLALDPSQPGELPAIKISSRVISVDPHSATVTFEDGSTAQGDVVIGADGSHSAVRGAVQQHYGSNFTPVSSGKNCFRFLIPRDILLQDPITKPLFEHLDTLFVWRSEEGRLVCYPCDDNTTMNFVGIHPASLSNAVGKSWNSEGSKEAMLSIFNELPNDISTALTYVDSSKIRLYPLEDMEQLQGWTVGRVALLGDAAHPFLPYLGQGGAQAIEDAISLGIVLTANVRTDDIPTRLQLYENIRKERAHKIQFATKMSGRNMSEIGHQSDADREELFNYLMEYNEIDNSTQALAAHLNGVSA